ncbi:MAG: hypothetical protein ABI342_04145 [Nitrososphaera sp.]|jgi:arginine repressor
MNKESIEKRRNLIRNIVIQNLKEGKQVSRHELRQALKEAGFDVSDITFYRDLSKIYVSSKYISTHICYSNNQTAFVDLLEHIIGLLDSVKNIQESGIKKGDNASVYSQILLINSKKIHRKLRGLKIHDKSS